MTGQPQTLNRDKIMSVIKEIPFHEFTTYRKLSSVFILPKSRPVYYIARDPRQGDIIRAHAILVHPKLREEHTTCRVFNLHSPSTMNHPEQLHPLPEVALNPGKFGFYDGFYDQVHVDEKLFYVQEVKQRFSLT